MKINPDTFSSVRSHGAPSSLGVSEPPRSEIFTWGGVTRDPFTASFRADATGLADKSVERSLDVAASRGDADMVKLLLRCDIHPAISSKALDIACKNGHYCAARLLFEVQGVQIVNPKALLLCSIQGGSLPLTEYLLGQRLGYFIDHDLANSILDTFEQIQHGYEALELILSMGHGVLNGKSTESAIRRELTREVELMLLCARLQFNNTEVEGIWEAALDANLTGLVGLLAKVKTVEALPATSHAMV